MIIQFNDMNGDFLFECSSEDAGKEVSRHGLYGKPLEAIVKFYPEEESGEVDFAAMEREAADIAEAKQKELHD